MGLISLVLATYGRCDDVGRMLDSLAVQTDMAFEVLIVDQNPDDRLLEPVARGLAAGLAIRHLRLDQPSLSGARNLGIAQAKGEIIGFPDDDCWYEPDTVAQVRRAFMQKVDIDGVVGCWVEEFVASGGRSPAGSLSHAEWSRFKGKGASSITLFFRRQLFEQLGGFDERFGVGQWYGAAEETDFILRILANGAQVMHCPTARVHHAFVLHQAGSLPASCRTMRRRGRGTGAIYAKHRINTFVILRGIGGQVIKPLLGGKWRGVIVGACVSLGIIEGFVKWRGTES